VKVTHSDKHTSLLRYGINEDGKSFKISAHGGIKERRKRQIKSHKGQKKISLKKFAVNFTLQCNKLARFALAK